MKNIKNKNIEFNSNPANINISFDVVESYINESLDYSFLVFNSINDILYLIYSNLDNSIISYNLIENKKIIEIKNSNYWSYITNFRHYLDQIEKRDLIMSISYDNTIKIWNVNNWECLFNISYINKVGYLYSACFINDNNQIYIISSNYYLDNSSEFMKVYDLKGNLIKCNALSYNDNTCFIDSYYDNKLLNNFIVSGNKDYVISYDFNKMNVYHKYFDSWNKDHNSLIINDKEEIVKLIESSEDGNIRIWDFHGGNLLKKFKICNNCLYGICLWNIDYLFVGCKDKNIRLIDLRNGKTIKCLDGHNTRVLTVKKIIHPVYGECLLSQGYSFNKIKLWHG